MIPFFKLASDNKIGQYLRNAIVEILLVVIELLNPLQSVIIQSTNPEFILLKYKN